MTQFMYTALFLAFIFLVISGLVLLDQQNDNHNIQSKNPPKLPPRTRNISVMSAPLSSNNLGPRGIKPEQFPCCPYDKLRNFSNGQQHIFWDTSTETYKCSRGHRFKSNGKLI